MVEGAAAVTVLCCQLSVQSAFVQRVFVGHWKTRNAEGQLLTRVVVVCFECAKMLHISKPTVKYKGRTWWWWWCVGSRLSCGALSWSSLPIHPCSH